MNGESKAKKRKVKRISIHYGHLYRSYERDSLYGREVRTESWTLKVAKLHSKYTNQQEEIALKEFERTGSICAQEMSAPPSRL